LKECKAINEKTPCKTARTVRDWKAGVHWRIEISLQSGYRIYARYSAFKCRRKAKSGQNERSQSLEKREAVGKGGMENLPSSACMTEEGIQPKGLFADSTEVGLPSDAVVSAKEQGMPYLVVGSTEGGLP
jgi:hypothetical protein